MRNTVLARKKKTKHKAKTKELLFNKTPLSNTVLIVILPMNYNRSLAEELE